MAGTSARDDDARFSYTLASAPAVSSLGTSSGSTAGGTVVVISGSNFTGATDVSFGGEPADFEVISATQIEAVAPSHAAGTIHVTVETQAGTSAVSSNDQFTYNAASAPTVTSLATATGTTAGGTLVGIHGTGFIGATGLVFGSVAASFEVVSDTLMWPRRRPRRQGQSTCA